MLENLFDFKAKDIEENSRFKADFEACIFNTDSIFVSDLTMQKFNNFFSSDDIVFFNLVDLSKKL